MKTTNRKYEGRYYLLKHLYGLYPGVLPERSEQTVTHASVNVCKGTKVLRKGTLDEIARARSILRRSLVKLLSAGYAESLKQWHTEFQYLVPVDEDKPESEWFDPQTEHTYYRLLQSLDGEGFASLVNEKIQLNTIYPTMSGEVGGAFPAGTWCTIIRFQGCSLGCTYCDTKDSLCATGGRSVSVGYIVRRILELNINNILITGGEPLEQATQLQALLCVLNVLNNSRNKEDKIKVQIETNGEVEVPSYLVRGEVDNLSIGWVFDMKLMNCGATNKNTPITSNAYWKNILSVLRWRVELAENDSTYIPVYVKAVVSCRMDLQEVQYCYNRFVSSLYTMGQECAISKENMIRIRRLVFFAISPRDGNSKIVSLIYEYILRSWSLSELLRKGHLILNIQLHKWVKLP